MDIQTNHRVQLLNAKCDYVNKLYNVCKKADYGDVNTDCCLKGMYAKSKLIDRMDCYCFPELITTTVTTTIFEGVLVASTTTYGVGTTLYLYINDVLYSSYTVTISNQNKQYAIYQMVYNTGIDFEYHQNDANGSTVFDAAVPGYYIMQFPCNINNIKCYRQDDKGGELIKITDSSSPSQEGVCEFTYTTCYNCIEDTDLPKMYEVIKKL